MPVHIKTRADTAANWNASNPILAYGEFGIEVPNLLKVGDGVTHWNALPYAGGSGGGVPADVLRNTTTGVVLYATDNTLVGSAFVIPGYYVKTATGWDFPPNLQETTLERFPITTFPYTPTVADARWGMIYLQPGANASVILPLNLVTSPVITNVRNYLDLVFYIEGAVTVTFTPAASVTLLPPAASAAVSSYAVAGPRKTVVIQARSNQYRVLD